MPDSDNVKRFLKVISGIRCLHCNSILIEGDDTDVRHAPNSMNINLNCSGCECKWNFSMTDKT